MFLILDGGCLHGLEVRSFSVGLIFQDGQAKGDLHRGFNCRALGNSIIYQSVQYHGIDCETRIPQTSERTPYQMIKARVKDILRTAVTLSCVAVLQRWLDVNRIVSEVIKAHSTRKESTLHFYRKKQC